MVSVENKDRWKEYIFSFGDGNFKVYFFTLIKNADTQYLSPFMSHVPLFWEFCILTHNVLSFLSSIQTGISTESRWKTGMKKEGGIRQ